MKALLIGDVHAVPEELNDCQALLDYVFQVQKDEKVDLVVFLGDQTHGHALAHLAVLDFWKENLYKLSHQAMSPQVVVLVGNHDHPVGDPSVNSMTMIQREGVTVVDKPLVVGNVLFCPYFPLGKDFEIACTNNPTPTVICHQTIAGAFYGGGLKLEGKLLEKPEVASVSLLPQTYIISGHLHSPQAFMVGEAYVQYVGAPRWRIASDANINRAIQVIEFDKGVVRSGTSFDTGMVCRQIKSVKDTPDAPIDISLLDSKHDWRVDIIGPAAWIEERHKLISRPGVKTRTFRVGDSAPRVRESEGIGASFLKFIKGFQPRYGTSQAILETMAKERLLVNVG